MLEYLSYKKYKKNKAEKAEKADKVEEDVKGKKLEEPATPEQSTKAAAADTAVAKPVTPAPVLHDDEQAFFERLTASWHGGADDDDDDAENRPALPPRVKTPDLTWDSDSESFRKMSADATAPAEEGKDKENEKTKGKKSHRISLFLRKAKKSGDKSDTLTVPPTAEAEREKDDLTRVLDDLNLSARNNNKAFSLSEDSTELMRRFTLVLKDLVNGVPTAVGDLTSLLDDPDGLLAKNFDKLPSSLKKLVTQLPEKLTGTLAPELLAVAAEAQGLSKEDAAAAAGGGLAGAAKRMLSPSNIKDLVTKPGAIVSMLKAIMNALKTRFPAFMGTNVIWSLALFLLLFVLWYCHKRGREVRLERQKSENVGVVDGGDRIEELPDDPALPAPGAAKTPVVIEPSREPEAVRSATAAK